MQSYLKGVFCTEGSCWESEQSRRTCGRIQNTQEGLQVSLEHPLMLLLPSSNWALLHGADWLEYPSNTPRANLTQCVSNRTSRLLLHGSEGSCSQAGCGNTGKQQDVNSSANFLCWGTYSSLSKVEANFYPEYLGSGIVPQALTGTLARCDRSSVNTTINRSLNRNIKNGWDFLCCFFSFFFPLSFFQLLSFLLLEQCCDHSNSQEAAHRMCLGKPVGCAI